MKAYTDIDTTVWVNDVEYDASFSFCHQAEEKPYFSHTQGIGDPGEGEVISITSCLIRVGEDEKLIDLYSDDYIWLTVKDINEQLVSDAKEYLVEQEIDYEHAA